MISDSIEQRRSIIKQGDEKIFLTPEIVDQIPSYLAHFEIKENRDMLRAILHSLDIPEPYDIHTYLYQIVFGERDSSLFSSQQELLLEGFAQKFLIESLKSSLPSFPYLLFSNEKCIVQLLNFFNPTVSEEKQDCAMIFLCSIFDHNPERSFIEMAIYEEIFELISDNLNLYPILISILYYSDELPKDIFPCISPIITNLLEQEDIFIASKAIFILLQLHEAEIDFDPDLIIQCEQRFINSIDEGIIFQLIILMKFAPEPPYQCLDRILELIDNSNSRIVKECLYILHLFGKDWDEDQRDQISDFLMTLFSRMPCDINFVFTSMTVEILLVIERLPIGDVDFFAKVVELVDGWDNISILIAISTILTKTLEDNEEEGKKMIMIIKSSSSFESLAQDKNPDVANTAQYILKFVDSFDSDE